jgi:hypothetical protein
MSNLADVVGYALYYNGKLFNLLDQSYPSINKRKALYETERAVKQVITRDAKEIAMMDYVEQVVSKNIDAPGWFALTETERDVWIEKVKARFQIVSLIPQSISHH